MKTREMEPEAVKDADETNCGCMMLLVCGIILAVAVWAIKQGAW